MHGHTPGVACPTRTAPRSAAAAVRVYCSGFCLVAFLLYPQTKRRRSQASRAGIHLVLGLFFPTRPQINLRLVRVFGITANPELNHHKPQHSQPFFLLFFFIKYNSFHVA